MYLYKLSYQTQVLYPFDIRKVHYVGINSSYKRKVWIDA